MVETVELRSLNGHGKDAAPDSETCHIRWNALGLGHLRLSKETSAPGAVVRASLDQRICMSPNSPSKPMTIR